MTLIEKFENLTPEQREKFAAVKDAAALTAFTSEYGIELTDEEKTQSLKYFQTGVLPLDDDDLDMVAGGITKGTAQSLAYFDGRFITVDKKCWCCGTKGYVYAVSIEEAYGRSWYRNCKCYLCDKINPSFEV